MSVQLSRFPVVPGGARVSFNDGFAAMRRHSGLSHDAIDIAAPTGTAVVSATDGLVARQWVTKKAREAVTGCGYSEAGGNIVVVVDLRGFAHYYAHLNQAPRVAPGAPVAAGDPLGEVGNTGTIARGSAPHLHYQVWIVGDGRGGERASGTFVRPFGRAVNPYSELRRLAASLGASLNRNGGVLFR